MRRGGERQKGRPVEWISTESLQTLVGTYGYLAIAVIVGLDSFGLPLLGETVLVLSALYAGQHHGLNI